MSRTGSILATFALLLVPSVASAGGFELPGEGGARGLGRGGAFYARADDPLALSLNPANLAELSGIQIYATGGLVTADGCFRRSGTYGMPLPSESTTLGFGPTIFDADPNDPTSWGAYGNTSFPESCNQSPLGPALNLAAAWRIMPELGVGIGILTPNGAGSSQWATDTEDFSIGGGPAGRLPPPGRYLLLEQDQLILHPSVGIAYRPVPWFRFGATFQWGIGVFDFTSITVRQPGQDPANDILARLHAVDPFVPAGIFSAHFVPHDSLDVMLGFKISDNIEAEGDTTLTTGNYGAGDEAAGVLGPVPLENAPLTGTRVKAGQPWEVRLGLRYAHRITPRAENPEEISRLSGRTEDAMSNEWFDIELDAIYLINKEVTDLSLALPTDAMATFREVGGGGTVDTELPLPDQIDLPHQWNDQWLLRLGGDFNAIPGLASLRLGFSLETSAYESGGVFSDRDAKRYVGLDFIPGMRFGIHAGLTVRISLVDVTLAYAHVFQETITVAPPPNSDDPGVDQASQRQISAVNPEMGEVVNAGTFTADYNMVQLGLNFHL